mmetsp:Transcript_102835/g.204143  ORF Transcript_102835/g.204143 Transcript_102835/m.204143 type:complete len:137 (-) Transcript_102835:86-496(-)|eukprot:CAMPEP_0172708746 /NCGR_PEP_ID=MMETSP1074-20121228/52019_1 /TAXON_ID=2916 /ORGANISM="Ceratium fusus, Strain PA161109" /LENGTH=136 /DNA_ID=CAMNT_0013531785 /DNA_START=65 /DNA_END=475 /DNA_ORIENTATION=+
MDDVKKFQTTVEDMQTRVQTQTLPLEKKMAQCALDCYNRGTDYNQIHQCVDGCQQSLQATAKKISGEFQALEKSVQACQQSCVQRLQPRMEAARGSPETQESLKLEYEKGVVRCIKEAEPTLPEMEARIKSYIKLG